MKIIDAELKVVQSEREHQYKLAELGMKAHVDQASHDIKMVDTQQKREQTNQLHGNITALKDHVNEIKTKHAEDVADFYKAIKAPRSRNPFRDPKAGKMIRATE